MKFIKKLLLGFMLLVFGLANISTFTLAQWSVDELLKYTIKWDSNYSPELYDAMAGTTTDNVWGKWADMFNEQVLVIIGYVIDIFIVIWIAIAFFWGYKIMMSDKEDAMKEWWRLVIFGIVWIIIMVSARFIAEWLVWDSGIIKTEFYWVEDDPRPNWVRLASSLYNKILFPFIRVVLYFAVWILFFMMAGKVFGFLTATDDSVKKKAWWVIIWCVVGILIIMWWKQLVEAIMWKQNSVLNQSATWIDEQWNPILWFENVPLISQIINWVMWLTMFAIVVLIIIQGYKMFTKPDDPKARESLKKTLLYILIWVIVIWASYAISTVLVVNKLPNIT